MKLVDILPSGKIITTQDIGEVVRKARKKQGATQADFAALCSVGVRFISELENGKPTAQVGKLLQVLKCLGLEVSIHPRGWTNQRKRNGPE